MVLHRPVELAPFHGTWLMVIWRINLPVLDVDDLEIIPLFDTTKT